jgi:hypothetical protein
MSTAAIVTMILALLLVWGGLAAAITLAVVRTRQQRSDDGAGTPPRG